MIAPENAENTEESTAEDTEHAENAKALERGTRREVSGSALRDVALGEVWRHLARRTTHGARSTDAENGAAAGARCTAVNTEAAISGAGTIREADHDRHPWRNGEGARTTFGPGRPWPGWLRVRNPCRPDAGVA